MPCGVADGGEVKDVTWLIWCFCLPLFAKEIQRSCFDDVCFAKHLSNWEAQM